MIPVRKLREACPRCSAQLLNLWERGFANSSPRNQVPLLPANRNPRSLLGNTRTSHRQFSTTRPILQEARPESKSPERESTEAIVRQAKETFGDTLPPGYLTPEEFRVYERLFGRPLRETRPEDVGIPFRGDSQDGVDSDTSKNTLLRETEYGIFEEVNYRIENPLPPAGGQEVSSENALETLQPPSEEGLDYINVTAKNQREYDALLKLQRDFEASSLRPVREDEIDENEPLEEEEDEIDEDEDEDREPGAVFEPYHHRPGSRLHQHTVHGRFKTSPRTVHLPKHDFIEPISKLLERTNLKHVQETAERAFGGPGLPYSPATPASKKNLPQKPVAMEAGHHRMSEVEADAYIATVLPGVYASVMSILVEVRKRLGPGWIQGLLAKRDGHGPRVLDAGAGGAGLLAWQEVLQAEWDGLRESGAANGLCPQGKKTVIVGSDNLRHRISRFLHNTTFLPRLPDYVHSAENAERLLDAPVIPQPRKTYDVILATHLLMPLDKPFKRKAMLDNLWSLLSPDGGVLVIVEKGHPRGFEAVADVRMRLLDEFFTPPVAQPAAAGEIRPENERTREPGVIIAPCTNHTKCPMYHTPGLSPGRKDFCHFNQRFTRPPFLQRIHDAKHRNHEDIQFSFIAVRRGHHPESPIPASTPSVAHPDSMPTPTTSFIHGSEAADRAFAGYEDVTPGAARPHLLSLPRSVFPPLKAKGHVMLDLCTPAGTLERWTVPRSFSRQAYHDARKARWGDLWALGAKTRVRRAVRLGRGDRGAEASAAPADGGVRSREAAEAGKRKKRRVIELNVDAGGIIGASERIAGGRMPVGRRTKGGRRVKIENLLEELGIDEEGHDDGEGDLGKR